MSARVSNRDLFLLGVWQGSWDARPDEVAAAEYGREIRVPVGISVVVPAEKLLAILDSPPLEQQRADQQAKWDAEADAELDAGS